MEETRPRGTRPDAITRDAFYLLKRVPSLHATYQVRLLTYLALQQDKKLVIRVPLRFEPAPSLRAYMERFTSTIHIEHMG